ncbi:MAG: hypothetical protein GY851_04500, partial [bacterium]|nr:hypothetical protein [bacterium]
MLLGILTMCAAAAPTGEAVPQLDVQRDGDTYQVRVLGDDAPLLTSPPEGLWSIAMDWRDSWPADWAHGAPTEMERSGEWTILRGTVETPKGAWHLSDSYRPVGNTIQCIRRYEWHGDATAERCTLSVRFLASGTGTGVVMPAILYHGNPSGAKSGRVPVYTGTPGEEAVYEEHRFPMPFVSFEWPDGDAFRGAALHSLPSPAPYANAKDQWWSMGLIARDDGTEFTLLSGPCASNGKRSVVKAVQPGFVPMDNLYLDVKPGAIIEKTFYL